MRTFTRCPDPLHSCPPAIDDPDKPPPLRAVVCPCAERLFTPASKMHVNARGATRQAFACCL